MAKKKTKTTGKKTARPAARKAGKQVGPRRVCINRGAGPEYVCMEDELRPDDQRIRGHVVQLV